jgi:D-beta-D-heptose 7-phosphate kinase/D-beta-D-heptose 1-phosphate adenosyltransferase
MEKIVIVTGGFDPVHSGHIKYITEARKLGTRLIVGANSDDWLRQKKGREFMPWAERAAILGSIRGVDEVWAFDDSDNSARDLIRQIRNANPKAKLIFANGGDRTDKNVPEQDIKDDNLEFIFGVGGEDKANSSSWILERWMHERTERAWGHFDILKDYPSKNDPNQFDFGCKLKELVVQPNRCLSYQRHQYRSELWYVRKGQGKAIIDKQVVNLYTGGYVVIQEGQWHQLINSGVDPLHIIEIQFGPNCDENDIERA